MSETRHTVVAHATAILSALLLLGAIGLVWLGGTQARVDAMLLLLGSTASLVYLGVRLPAVWTGAVVFLLVSIAANSLLAFQGTALVVAPVAMPAILALFSLAALCCLVSMRPPPPHDMPEGPWPLADFIRTLLVLVLLLLAEVGLLWVGCSEFSVHRVTLIQRLGGLVAIVDAMLLLGGSAASLVYLVARVPAARRGALASFLISMASSGLLVVLVIASFPEIRRHGCVFAGMDILVGMSFCVALVVLALLTLWAFFCVRSIRPRGR